MEKELLIHKIFASTVLRQPDNTALQIKKDSQWQGFTYAQTEGLSLKVSAFLLKEGIKKGDFAALMLENRPEWAMIYLGVVSAGAACVPIDTQLSRQELENILNDCRAKVLFTSYHLFTKQFDRGIIKKFQRVVILDLEKDNEGLVDFAKIEQASANAVHLPQANPEDIASLIYTSGTTATPKGVILTHRNLCSNFISLEKLNICRPTDNLLSILPLHHTYAFMVTLLVPLFLGAKVTYAAGFRPEDLTGIIKEAGVTVLVGVPQLFNLLNKAIFEKINRIPFILRQVFLPLIKKKVRGGLGGSLRLFVSGGARLNPQIARDLSRLGLTIIEGYGLTETSPVVTINPPQKIKFGSVGQAIPEVNIKILNPDKSGRGEVLIKGANVMQGYFKQPELTAQVITDGWFHSGDLGYLDKEGYLFLTGREKDVIVLSSGKNIYPDELEEYFTGQSPYIKEMCVLGVKEKKFGVFTESLHAVVVADLDYFRRQNEINIYQRIRWEIDNLSKKLPPYQHIMGFTITKEELPRTRLRKIKRYQVRDKYLKEGVSLEEVKELAVSEEDKRILETDSGRNIINYLRKELKKNVYLDSHLEIDLGIDSLSRVELGLGLEALLKIKIPPEAIEDIFTVKDIVLTVERLAGAQKGKEPVEIGEERKSWQQLLNEAPPQEIIARIKLNASFANRVITFLFKIVLCFMFRALCFLKIEGRENIPKQPPFIFCPNHASYLDGFVLFSSAPLHCAADLFFLGHAAIFNHPFVAWLVKFARLISIDPSVHLTEAMQASSYVLGHKKVICIFPEGQRSIGEKVGDFKKGVGILAKELDAVVIPVHIKGSHYCWPRTSRFPRPHPLKITFGKPLNWRVLGDDYKGIVDGLRNQVIKLEG